VQEVTLHPTPHRKARTRLPAHFGERVLFALKPDLQYIPIDAFVLAFHGEYGEDGCIQELLDLGNYPYTGCPMLATAWR
jgi:D-alanine-D-alanine ligase-like ATP-grasp enzyme